MNKHRFKLPIGDWSDDGHGKCDYFVVESNKSVAEVREVHHRIKETTGIDIHEICSEYEESSIDSDMYVRLAALGYNTHNVDLDEVEDEEDSLTMSSEDMVKLWVWLLMKVDATLELTVSTDIPMLPFYGYRNGQHIDFVGYGCFN